MEARRIRTASTLSSNGSTTERANCRFFFFTNKCVAFHSFFRSTGLPFVLSARSQLVFVLLSGLWQGERVLASYRKAAGILHGDEDTMTDSRAGGGSDDDGIPWKVLLRVTNALLEKPFASVESLQASLVGYEVAQPYASQHSHSIPRRQIRDVDDDAIEDGQASQPSGTQDRWNMHGSKAESKMDPDNLQEVDVLGQGVKEDVASQKHRTHSLVRVIDIELVAATTTVGTLAAHLDPQGSSGRRSFCEQVLPLATCSNESRVPAASVRPPQQFFLIGDSAFLAHYRLGVGCNAMFHFVELLQDLISNFALDSTSNPTSSSWCFDLNEDTEVPRAEKDGDDRNITTVQPKIATLRKQAREMVASFVEFQLSTMFFESFCDLIVFFNSDPANGPVDVFNAQLLYQRNVETGSYIPPSPPWHWVGWAGGSSAKDVPASASALASKHLRQRLEAMCSR